MPQFSLGRQQSLEILDGTNHAGDLWFAYRITLEEANSAELKIIRDPGRPKMLGGNAAGKSVDVIASRHLFLETTGNGVVRGSYEFLGLVRGATQPSEQPFPIRRPG